ncbi:MAG TPA: hypothetical protein VFV15_00230 [Moraxellaceae bacterium]|nr:hypothetical protein [Moraxellaceae bacterium]
MARDDLHDCLQALAPGALRKLSDADRQALHALVDRARRQRAADHAAAIDSAVAQVPAMLRSTVRRMLAE